MRTTIDSAGCIVVPKPLRDELGLLPGQVLELELTDGRLQVEIAPVDIHVRDDGACDAYCFPCPQEELVLSAASP